MKFLSYISEGLLLERNIVNTDAIDDFITHMISLGPRVLGPRTPQTKELYDKWVKWCNSNLRNYLLKDYDRVQQVDAEEMQFAGGPRLASYTLSGLGKEWRQPAVKSPSWLEKAIAKGEKFYSVSINQIFSNQISHVLDFFVANPNLRFERMSVPESIRQSEAWTEKINKKALATDDPAGVVTIKTYPNDFRWVKLTSKQALDREGKLMRHCVGSYYDKIISNRSIIYSLRDNKNEPHCTIEVNDLNRIYVLNQIKGKANGEVDEKYLKYVKDFVLDNIDNPHSSYRISASLNGLMNSLGLVYTNSPPDSTRKWIEKQ
jgi:hypothetical protein